MTQLKPVRLKPGHYENTTDWLPGTGLALGRYYAVLGEWGTTKHIIVMDVTAGKVVPGVFHLDRFEEIPEEDL